MVGPRDKPTNPQDVDGGDRDIATDVQPLAAPLAKPNKAGGMLSEGGEDDTQSETGDGGMIGEG